MPESADTRTDVEMVRFKLNGEDVEEPRGTLLIAAAHRRGIDVPYFCYHPGLTPEGNCRMCLVEASNSRKPVPACMTHVTEGVEFQTHSEAAKAARADVLEFMLVNHPLDCPICDKSGECLLQDNSYEHGKDHSRMIETKELKPTKELGNDIWLWGNRCIVCTRCVRFCHEIAGTGELAVVERGDRSVIDVFPDYPLGNPLSGNVVDICPVGALISKDFLYEARVWFEKKTESICNGCARGCNIDVETLNNQVKRLVPRHNGAVNDYWMCDHGRYDFKYILGEKRWLRYRMGGAASNGRHLAPAQAAAHLEERLRALVETHGPSALGAVASASMTLETLHLLRRFLGALGVPLENIAARARPGWEEREFPGGFRISGDDNPNRAGAKLVLGDDVFERGERLAESARRGEVRGLIVFSDLPHHPLEDAWIGALEEARFGAVFLLETDPRIPARTAIIPATAFSERQGTLVNEDGRVQLMNQATQLPRGILPEHEVLQEALRLGGHRKTLTSPAGVFREIGEVVPALAGWTYRDIGPTGRSLGESASPAGLAGDAAPEGGRT